MSLCIGAHGRQIPWSLRQLWITLSQHCELNPGPWQWQHVLNHRATSPAPVCVFSTAATVSSPGTGGGGGDMDGRTCSLARFVKTMFNHPQVYITCPALGKILEMQACNYTVVVTMFFTSTVLQRPSQMSQAILLPIFKDRQFLSTHPPFFVLFWFLR